MLLPETVGKVNTTIKPRYMSLYTPSPMMHWITVRAGGKNNYLEKTLKLFELKMNNNFEIYSSDYNNGNKLHIGSLIIRQHLIEPETVYSGSISD